MKKKLKKIFNKFVANIIVKPIDEHIAKAYENCEFSASEIKEYLHIHFCNLLYAIYSKIPPLEYILHMLCEWEMSLRLLFDKEDREDINNLTYEDIPLDMLYCRECPYWDRSHLARFLFGSQSQGFCHYLNRGDFSNVRPTMLLWDGCKECGERTDEDLEVSYDEENGFELGKDWEKIDE